MDHRTATLIALATTVALAVCVSPDAVLDHAEDGPHLAPVECDDWAEGSWWSYRTTFHTNTTVHLALVVDEASEDGYRLGTNTTSGFFGLPFTGNMTSDLNPEVAGETWRMFDFPLEEGKAWEQELFGHTVKTKVTTGTVDLPAGDEVPAYTMEARTYGQVLARYTYVPAVGWMDRLTLWDPGTGEEILHAELTGHGASYDDAYYVTEPLEVVEVTYPGPLPGAVDVRVPPGYEKVTAFLKVEGTAGALQARFLDPHGREVLGARVVGTGLATDRAELPPRWGTWTLEHEGTGVGDVRLEVHGVRAVDHAYHGSSSTEVGGGTAPVDAAVPLLGLP